MSDASGVADKEIEIKIKVATLAPLLSFLKKQAAFTGEHHQKDEYFTPAHRAFLEVDPVAEWLRLRGDEAGHITYKHWHFDSNGVSSYCDEYETEVASIEQLRKILVVLDFRPVVMVEKVRKTWRYQDYEVAIDDVVGLGAFVEVEYKGHDTGADPVTLASDMIKFLKQAGCTDLQRSFRGYPYMLLYPGKDEFRTV